MPLCLENLLSLSVLEGRVINVGDVPKIYTMSRKYELLLLYTRFCAVDGEQVQDATSPSSGHTRYIFHYTEQIEDIEKGQ
jgi:hypothetical protein